MPMHCACAVAIMHFSVNRFSKIQFNQTLFVVFIAAKPIFTFPASDNARAVNKYNDRDRYLFTWW